MDAIKDLDFRPDTVRRSGSAQYSLGSAAVMKLNPGDDIDLATFGSRPGENFPATVKLFLNMYAVATGTPYEFIAAPNLAYLQPEAD